MSIGKWYCDIHDYNDVLEELLDAIEEEDALRAPERPGYVAQAVQRAKMAKHVWYNEKEE